MATKPVRMRITKFVKPYVLRMCFSNRYVTAEVVETSTGKVALAASSKEEALKAEMPRTADVLAAAKIGEVLAQRMKDAQIPGIVFHLAKGERYHGKRKALVDGLTSNGITLI